MSHHGSIEGPVFAGPFAFRLVLRERMSEVDRAATSFFSASCERGRALLFGKFPLTPCGSVASALSVRS